MVEKATKKKTAAKKSAKNTAASANRLTVTLVKSTIGFDKKKQGLVVQSLGLRWLNHTIEVADTPAVRGMLLKVRHLVTVTSAK